MVTVTPVRMPDRRRCTLLAAVTLLILAVAAAHASPHVESGSERQGRRRVGVLRIQGRTALTLRTSNQDLSPVDRAEQAAETLRSAVAEGGAARRIGLKRSGRSWTVLVGSDVLVRATTAEARAQHTTSKALAASWSSRIRALLLLPSVSLSSARLVVPLGETRTLTIGGVGREGWDVDVPAGAEVAAAELRGRHVVVRGSAVGKARVVVSLDDERASCLVLVKKQAGKLVCSADAEVTGRVAPADLLEAAAALALRRYAAREPGAHVSIVSPPRARRGLAPDQATTLVGRVRIAGGDYLPVEGPVSVRVRNRALPERPVDLLLYSNEPERVRQPQTLYAAALPDDRVARLFYHHVNNTRRPLALAVTVINRGSAPASLHIVPGFTHPDIDPVRAGHGAGRSFFRRYRDNAGEVYTLPARSTLLLALDAMSPGETASGMAQVRVLGGEGADCLLRVSAERWSESSWARADAGYLDAWRHVAARPATQAECAPPSAVLGQHVYPEPVKKVQAGYTVGSPWTWIRIGHETIRSANGAQTLAGGYGVVYDIQVRVENPTQASRQVEVAFDAGAGQAAGVFAIGSRLIDVPSVFPREEYSLARFDLGPGQVRQLTIQTIPLGGSSYPAALVVR